MFIFNFNENSISSGFKRVGFFFFFTSIFVFFPLAFFINYNYLKQISNYDYENINKRGKIELAKVEKVEKLKFEKDNKKIKNIVFNYTYKGRLVKDSFQTLDDNIVEANDVIKIKIFKGESMIISLNPFTFSSFIIFILPSFFILIGICFIYYKKVSMFE